MTRDLLIDGDQHRMWYGDSIIKIDILSELMTPMTPQLGMLPAVTRWISPLFRYPGTPVGAPVITKMAFALVEGRPNYRTIIYEDTPIRIPVPWQHYLYELHQSADGPVVCTLASLFYSLTPLESEDHMFYFAPLPNVHSAYFENSVFMQAYTDHVARTFPTPRPLCSVCYGSFPYHSNISALNRYVSDLGSGDEVTSFNTAHQRAMVNFWSTNFNADYHAEFYDFIGQYFESDDDDYDEAEKEHVFTSGIQESWSTTSLETMFDLLALQSPIMSFKALKDTAEQFSSTFSLTDMFARVTAEAENTPRRRALSGNSIYAPLQGTVPTVTTQDEVPPAAPPVALNDEMPEWWNSPTWATSPITTTNTNTAAITNAFDPAGDWLQYNPYNAEEGPQDAG